MVIETWRAVAGYEGLYEVSDLGRIRGVDRLLCNGHRWAGRLLRTVLHHGGYVVVNLSRDNRVQRRLVHCLVAEAFLPPDPTRVQVNHKNGATADNRLANLERATPAENARHSYRELRRPPSDGGQSRPVVAKVPGGAETKFTSVAAAARNFGVARTAISYALQRPGRLSGGCAWRYA